MSTLYDINVEVKKVKNFRPAPGVSFVEYDELGLPKNDGFDYYKYITTDTETLDHVIDASPDQMERALRPSGIRYDIDKEREDMNEEGKFLRLDACNNSLLL